MEMLSEHTCEGWLEGYILSGRHGLLNSYEPFIHVIDSMVNQVCCVRHYRSGPFANWFGSTASGLKSAWRLSGGKRLPRSTFS